jgi:hypothetical protein
MVPAAQSENGDLFWFSDDDGDSWTRVDDATIVGGGDTDVATRFGPEVYGTGLTLANITLTASCDNGAIWAPNRSATCSPARTGSGSTHTRTGRRRSARGTTSSSPTAASARGR